MAVNVEVKQQNSEIKVKDLVITKEIFPAKVIICVTDFNETAISGFVLWSNEGSSYKYGDSFLNHRKDDFELFKGQITLTQN